MTNLFVKIVNILTTDPTLTVIVPATNILVGPVDIAQEQVASLTLPQINLHQITELTNLVPKNTRETSFQLDIWSRDSQLEVENIYERILTLLNYLTTDQGGNHIFYERSSGSVDMYETDRRIWHRATTFEVWVQ